MDAFLVRLSDPKHQEYIQKHPALRGPDAALNRRLRQAACDHIEIRKPARVPFSHETIDTPLDALLAPDDSAALVRVCASVGLDATLARGLSLGWGWKAALSPRAARRVLSIGCGGGLELVVLRALFPDAEIQGVDYAVTVPAGWRTALRLGELRSEPIEQFLSTHARSFDLIFSNHTLEHLSAPESVLRLMREALVPGGACVSAVPLEGSEDNPFYRDLRAVAEGKGPPDLQLDIEFINPSHAWKTNHADLAATLHEAGFTGIRLFTRVQYPSNYHRDAPMHISQFRRRRLVGRALEKVTLSSLRRILHMVYPGELAELVVKTYFTIASRCWFSRVRALHELVPEVAFVANVPA
jgi:SAM-dependent methyltransferase